MIHCHYCKTIYDNVHPGTRMEKLFIVTNVCDSSPDLKKIYFCTLNCYSTFLTLTRFRAKESDSPEEAEERKKEFLAVYLSDTTRHLLANNPGIQEWARQELVDRVPIKDVELFEEKTLEQKKDVFDHNNGVDDWADFN